MLFFLSVIAISIGNAANFEFDQYTAKSGLSNGYINTVFHDSRGFILVGTSNGFNRFDGRRFKQYYYKNNDPSTISGIGVHSIIEDLQENLWVGTSSGICIYRPETDNFVRKTLLVNGNLDFNFLTVQSFFIDTNNNFWISSYQGILKFNLHQYWSNTNDTIEAQLYTIKQENVDEVYLNYYSQFQEDNSGNLWIASYDNSLFCFNEKNNRFEEKPIKINDNYTLHNKGKQILIDSDDNFYLSVEGSGIFVKSNKQDTFVPFGVDSLQNRPPGKNFQSIIETSDGGIWIGDQDNEGISIFNKQNKTFTHLNADNLNPYSLITNKINSIYEDKNGLIWVGTIIGLNKYSSGKSKFKRYFSNPNQPQSLSMNNVLCFDEGKNGTIWIGTDGGGLNALDRNTGRFTHYTHTPGQTGSISSNAIISICEDHQGTLWTGTYKGGLNKMTDKRFQSFMPDPDNPYSISSDNIWYVFEDSKKNIWIGTLNSGIDFYHRESNRFYNYIETENITNALSGNSINHIFEDSRQNLYISTTGGVSVIDLNATDFTQMPPDISFKNYTFDPNANSISSFIIECVNEDRQGIIWIGTLGSGLDRFDPETGIFTNYTSEHGLPGNSITSILIDRQDYLWLATDNGLARFNTETLEVLVFDQADGLQNKSLKGKSLKTSDGEMFFGGADGFNSFYPHDAESGRNINVPPVVLTGLKLFNQKVNIGQEINGNVVLKQDISVCEELTLTHKENFFSLEFAALDFVTPEKNEYAYMMEGFDNDWIYAENNNSASYTNLDAGTYTFKLKASNNEGIWNNEGTSIVIIILPPWWESWWCRTIIILILTFTIAYLLYQRIKQIEKQKRVLQKLVSKRTQELQETNQKLREQTNELIRSNKLLEEHQAEIETQSEELSLQKESLQELNRELENSNTTKDKFLSIIAHDIKSPFNAIIGFSNLLKENYNIWDDKKILSTVDIILQSSENLHELLENLLHWSRNQRGIIEFNPQQINTHELFDTISSLMRAHLKSKNITLSAESEKNLLLFADKFMVELILRNLISNAIKFTHPEGNIKLNVRKDGSFAKFEVSDNGTGIPRQIRDNLFSIETSHTTPGTNNEKGTGLGLALCKDFVRQHGGEIGVTSTVGKGSTFHFTLPIKSKS